MARADTDTARVTRRRVATAGTDSVTPPTGTVLVRAFRGEEIRVTVLDRGFFEWNGGTFRSLSAVAKAITGSHCSGPAFFGLTRKRNG